MWQAPGLVIPRRISALALFAGLAAAGCGSQARNQAPPASAVATAFKGSPPPLATIHDQANQLLGGGPAAFHARLRALRHQRIPVVVNEWASWCGPCQSEFPVYQQVAVADGRSVAFVGIDAKDQNPAAASFLRRFPVTYPSYTDPNGSIATSIQAYAAYPQTFFYDRSGTMVYDKAGPYLSASELERDIKHYVSG